LRYLGITDEPPAIGAFPVTVYVTDLNDVQKMNEVYKRLMADPKPARATVQVAGLIGDGRAIIVDYPLRRDFN
jgi:hypothetical protein